jgi:H+/Cl- antiporter ClcA
VLVLWQRTKRLPIGPIVMIVLAGMAAYGVLWAIEGDAEGFGGIPSSGSVEARDYVTALLLGVVCVPIGLLLRALVGWSYAAAQRIEARLPWWVAALAFGAVLGGLYLAGGESVQFSGAEGTGILVSDAPDLGWLALAGILVCKLAVAAWSLGTGYRGGLVFPSVFVGVALGLTVGAISGDVTGPGLAVGAIGGILAQMTMPVLAVIMLLALLPLKFAGLGVAAAAGVLVGRWAIGRATGAAHRAARADRTS